jgi:diguanylate cyclase (GGDEF)-like protein
LFNGEDFIGSVELSLSPATIIQELYNMTENQGYGYLLNKSIMENVDFCDEQNQYRLSLTSDLYVVDLEVYQIMVNQPGVPDLFFEDDFVSAVRMGVEKDLAKGQSFMYTLNYQDQYYLIEYDQIKDISGQAIGYFFSVSEDEQIANLIQARDLSLLLIAIVYFMLLLMIHYVNRRDKEIMQVAMYDQLTEIYNRRSFFELAHVEVEKNNRSNQPLAVAIFDIDHFKMVNDRFGHHVGDQVLRELAQIIKASIRSYDIFARLGGEEFILLMPETNQKVALLVMERIRLMVLNHSFQTAEKITISIGLTEKKQNESLDATIVRADTAMYTAKGNGRNRTELL